MTHIRERVSIQRQVGGPPTSLEHFVDQLSTSRRGAPVIDLRLPSEMAGLHGDPGFGRDIVATLTPMTAGLRGKEQRTLIRWVPGSSGQFSTFSGTLTLRVESENQCSITLDGYYEPPFGTADRSPNANVGRHVAGATARELLRRIKVLIEARAAA
jgi:hypothetical protein